MHIVFDAYWWAEGPVSNRAVQRQIITTWLREFPADTAVVVVPSSAVVRARTELRDAAQVISTKLRPHGVAAALDMGRIANQLHADVVLTHNFAPIRHRSAVFIHDVLFKSNPEWFTPLERAYFALIPRLAPRAELILTSSATEAERIRGYVPRVRQVKAVGLGVPERLTEVTPTRPTQLNGVEEFVLTVGRLNVRKNLAGSLTAVLASGVVNPARPLVVVGFADGRGAPLPPELHQAIGRGTIRVLDGITDAELAWLYSSAALFVFLSLDEGYGLTPVEALHFGCPVVASDIPVFRETLGQRATLVPPLDAHLAGRAIAEAFHEHRRPSAADRSHDSWECVVARIRGALN